jgi:hypothetical protein
MRTKTLLLILLILAALVSGAQDNAQDALVVYGLSGKVTAVYKNVETAVKIGKVLFPGTMVKTDKDASVTLLCKKGMQFVINTPGNYAVSKYKDSCKVNDRSVSSNYLSYIWGQFYAYSPEHKNENGKKENLLAVSRSPGNENKRKSSSKKLQIEFSPGMDTMNYGGKDFPLSWSCFDYDGIYVFRLYDEKGGRVLYMDSTEDNFIRISKLRNLILPGGKYKWNVSAPKAGLIRKRELKYISQEEIDNYISSLMAAEIPSEDQASRFFRIGYMLEQKHYLADALLYYDKANKADPGMHAYRDKLVKFRNEFWVQDGM